MKKVNQLGVLTMLVALGAGGTYALAQSKGGSKPAAAAPSAAAPSAAPKPAAQTPAEAAPAQPADDEAACGCAACEGHGGKQGMGCAMKGGMHKGMGGCPLMQHGGMPAVTVKVENTTQGAVLKLEAKAAADAEKVQQMAQMMAKHLEGGGCHMMHGEGGPAGDKDGMHKGHAH